MHRANSLKAAVLAVALVTTGGCAGTAVKEETTAYAPTYPVAAQMPRDHSGSIYKAGFGVRLFEDTKAHRVGDLITVMLSESTKAQKKASTTTAKEQNIDFPTPTLFGRAVTHDGRELLNNSVGMGNDFSGDGASSQSNSLSGSITVFVAQVLPNGNLVVRGEKKLTLNQGDEYIRITGIVRPMDVSPDNTVSSTKVANAEIIYSGDGAISDANSMGWLARFFNGPLWPF
ncbi:MAG: flagellar basal body L-ring protein FlgH [Gammaproteobacteria bacterium]|nr:flagellar basal body L-ring protein FlgH [Gammaproteobacteria bacterium]